MAQVRIKPGSLSGGFLLAQQSPRAAKGALRGESKDDRDKRVLAYIRAHPHKTNEEVEAELKVPFGVVQAMRHQGKLLDQEARAKVVKTNRFGPPAQRFTPSPAPAGTPRERIASLSREERERIAAQYGARFR